MYGAFVSWWGHHSTLFYVCQPVTCASFILLSLFTNLKCNICTVSRNHFLLSATQKFQFYTIYAIFLIMWYIKCVSEIHIVLPMTCDPPRNVKMPELFTLRHFSHQFLLYFRLQNRSPALHQPYRQYNFLGDRLILQTLRNIFHAQFCHFFHRLMDRRDRRRC